MIIVTTGGWEGGEAKGTTQATQQGVAVKHALLYITSLGVSAVKYFAAVYSEVNSVLCVFGVAV